ncbi:hypothetical protein GGI23_000105 [Coemansia sp. RSA 2559]|nr:hypothetical protein GGI23_000105 [Coemansia sp. RSA 2559]KAJ2869495.1 hypothetical protein GGI22_000212 [Coemansia erecta]
MPIKSKRSRAKRGKNTGEAGVSRFPSTIEIIKTVDKKRSTSRASSDGAAAPHAFVDYRLLTQVANIVSTQGDLMQPSKNKLMMISVFPLREAFRQLPSSYTWRLMKLRPSSKQVELMRAMLSTAGDPSIPADTLRVARKRMRQSGQAVIDFAGNSEIPADQTDDPYVGPFAWIIVQDSNAVDTIAAALTVYRATHLMFLPSFDDRKNAQLMWREPIRKSFNRTVRDYANEWQQSAQGKVDAMELVSVVRRLVRERIPSFTASVDIYGSRLYGMCSEGSDVDIAIDIQRCPKNIEVPRKYLLSALERVLNSVDVFSGVAHLRHARIPIIRFKYLAPSGRTIHGEISANGKMGCAKSQLIAAYIEVDPRVRQVLALLKAWSIGRKIDAPLAVNWFGILMMAIAYLIKERVVPPLQLLSGSFIDRTGWMALRALQQDPQAIANLYSADADSFAPTTCLQSGAALPAFEVDGCRTYFVRDHREIEKWRSPNQLSPIRLLHDMFKFYGYSFDPMAHVVSARLGSPQIPRASLFNLAAPDPSAAIDGPEKWTSSLRTLAIEDPFELTVNCARHAPAHWVDGLLWEMRRAAWTISRKSPFNGPFTAIDRLALPPSKDIYCDAGVWAAAAFSVGVSFIECQRTGPLRKLYIPGPVNDRAATERLKRHEDIDLELAGKFKIPSAI